MIFIGFFLWKYCTMEWVIWTMASLHSGTENWRVSATDTDADTEDVQKEWKNQFKSLFVFQNST